MDKRYRQLTTLVGILIIGAVIAGFYVVPKVVNTANTVETSLVVKTPESSFTKNTEIPSRLTLPSPNATLATVLEANDVSYGKNGISHLFEGIIAVQQEHNWAFVLQNWSVTVDGRTIPLKRAYDIKLHDGDKVRFTYHRRVVKQVALPARPAFITYIKRNASRNAKQRYISCTNNEAIHKWKQRQVEPPDYPSSPPVCGAHLHHDGVSIPHSQDDFIREDPLRPAVQTHILGHGMTIVQYSPSKTAPETVRRLEGWARNHSFVYTAPNPEMDEPIVVTRWGMSAPLASFNRTKLELFQQAPFGILPWTAPPTYLPPLAGSTLSYYHAIPPSHIT